VGVNEWSARASRAEQSLEEVSCSHAAAVQSLEAATSELSEKRSLVDTLGASMAAANRELELTRGQLDQKSKELGLALSSIGDIQKSACEREATIREVAKAAEEKMAAAVSEVQTLKDQVAKLGFELESCRSSLVSSSAQVEALTTSEAKAKAEAREFSESLGIEKELRSRAETREGEERRERVSACAQLVAQTQAQGSLVTKIREEASSGVAAAEAKCEAALADLETAHHQVRDAKELLMTAEGESQQLRCMLEKQQSNTEELVKLAHQTGEVEALRHRMQTENSDHAKALVEAKSRIAALEEEVRGGEAQRRKMHNLIQELRGNVRVFARVRPFLPSDSAAEESSGSAVEVRSDGESLVIAKPGGGDEVHGFSFDKAFPPSVGQEQVFTEVSEFVQSALDGYQVCLFSYGQTGSGKTHTMQGSGHGPMKGIIPRAIEQVGRYKETLEAQGWSYAMEVTFVELYNEQIRDLLRPSDSKAAVSLDLRTLGREVVVQDVTRLAVDPRDDQSIVEIMDLAARHRAVGVTDMNAQSSRSHSVFTLHLKGENAQLKTSMSGALNLVDLAGSERLSRSGATGDRMKETQAINKSLSCLTDVFMALSNKNSHIPFRNSKLTHLLSPCLSGDGKTLMMVNLSPTQDSYFETLCSLRFASTVNKCELGRPKKQVRELGGSASNAAAPKKSKK